MSEAILKALMQLFALIGDIHDDTVITSRERNIVRLFLIRHLNNELVEKYMRMFEEYLGIFNSESIVKGSIQDRKRISLNSMRILEICEKINEELEQKQKVYVLVKLMDYILNGEEVTETELDFLHTVSDSFNIPAREYSSINLFIMDPAGLSGENVLVVEGTIRFLYIQSTNTYLMKYSGDEDLYLNGQTIQNGESYIFDSGSSVRGAGIKAIFYSEVVGLMSSASFRSAVFLDASGVTFRFRKSENGIHDLNFTGKSGELAGIMGGSGAGKSTTLSILSGTLRPQNGKVMINGIDLHDEAGSEKLKGVIGFVPQDDLLIEELTVYQNLYYNAKMCLSNLQEDELKETVEKMLADLDLTEAKDLKVGNPLMKVISGGQRKRINIALELMREPTILFVDEPTSGLSSVDSEMVMNLLKDLTYKGKLVIVNIHQPSSEIYKMFDKILIIDRGGYQVFCGNPTEAIIYFKVQTNHANPDEDQCTKCGNIDTEQLLQIIEAKVVDEHGRQTRVRKISPKEWAERFRAFSVKPAQREPGIRPLPDNKYSIPGLLKQSFIFFTRDILSKIADKQYMIISLLGPPLLALLLSFFIKTPAEDYSYSANENIPAYLFMCIITSMFFGLMASSEEIVSDRKILKRESFLNLSWFSYLNSKIWILFILSAIQTLSFVLAGNLVLEIRGMTPDYWLVLFTTSCFGNMLGLILSSAFRSVITIYILIPFIIIPQLLFSGVMVKFDKLHTKNYEFVPFIGDVMIARWTFEALAIKQFRDNDYEKPIFEKQASISENAWYSNFLVPALRTNLQFAGNFRNDPGRRDEVHDRLGRLRRHTAELSEVTGYVVPEGIKALFIPEKLDSAAQKAISAILDTFKIKLSKARKLEDSALDSIYEKTGDEKLLKLRTDHENVSLKEEVLYLAKAEQSLETDDKIIRKLDPGFMKAYSPFGRAHFYAPSKKLGSREIDTYLFNLAVVWIITALLFLMLIFKIPEKLIYMIENSLLLRWE